MSAKNQAQVRMIVFGVVQGVFFRASTKQKAEELGLKGWVKNKPNGSVEICAQGHEDAVDKLVGWCYHGPENAEVETVEMEWQEPTDAFEGFEIR